MNNAERLDRLGAAQADMLALLTAQVSPKSRVHVRLVFVGFATVCQGHG